MSLRTTNATNLTSGNDRCPSGVQAGIINIPIMLAALCVGCLIIILNIPAIVTVFFVKVKSSNFVYLHILSLGLTDAGVGLVLVFNAAVKLFTEDHGNFWYCVSRVIMTTAIITCTGFQLAAISFDRLLLFRTSTWKSFTRNASFLIKMIIGTFLFAVSISTIPLLVIDTTVSKEECVCDVSYIFQDKVSAMLIYYGVMYISLLMFNVVCASMNIGLLWKHKQMKQRINPSLERSSVTRETRGMITLSIITGLHVVTTAPCSGYFLVQGFSGENIITNYLMPLLSLGCLSSACNPVVYSYRIPEMREALKLIWEKTCKFKADETVVSDRARDCIDFNGRHVQTNECVL